MGLPPSFLLAFHWIDIEVEYVATTSTLVGAEGTNVCVMAGKNKVSKLVCLEFTEVSDWVN